jgi:hypothetical protein
VCGVRMKGQPPKSTPEAWHKLAQRVSVGKNSAAKPSAVGAARANFIRALSQCAVQGGWSRGKCGQKKRGAWQTHTRLPTNKSIFRVPQGSPPYRHSMSIPHYKSSSADSVKPARLTLSHQRIERSSLISGSATVKQLRSGSALGLNVAPGPSARHLALPFCFCSGRPSRGCIVPTSAVAFRAV